MLIPCNMVVQAVFVCQVTWLSFYRDLALFNLAFFTQFSRSYFPYVLPFDFSKSIPVCVAVFQKYVELIFEGFLLKCSWIKDNTSSGKHFTLTEPFCALTQGSDIIRPIL